MGLLLVRVAPRDHEDLHPLADEVLDEAAPRREVEDVVLVDRRRDEEQRDLVDLLRRRLVLDELEDLRAEHDRARGGGDVAADLELRGVDALRQSRRPGDVGREAPRAADQVRAALVDDRAQDGRIGEREVAGRDGVEHVARREARLTLRLPVELGVRDQAVDGLARRQVALHHPAEQPVLLPGGVREAAVALRGRPARSGRRRPARARRRAPRRAPRPCAGAGRPRWRPRRWRPGRGSAACRSRRSRSGARRATCCAAWRGVVVAMRATVRPPRGAPNGGRPKIARVDCPGAHKSAYDRPAMSIVERGSVVQELAAELLTEHP